MKNSIWYPEFGFRRNPFQYADRATETEYLIDVEDYRLIRTKAVDRIMEIVLAETSAIIVGEKGCGKSASIEIISLDPQKRKIYSIAGARTFKDLYNEIYDKIFIMLKFDVDTRDLHREISERVGETFSRGGWLQVKLEYTSTGEPSMVSPLVCNFPQCYKRIRCVLVTAPKKKIDVSDVWDRAPNEINCPLRQWLVIHYCEAMFRLGEDTKTPIIYLFDVPDDLAEINPRYFTNFMQDFRKETNSVVVLMATRDQYSILRKTEYFSRWMKVDFPKISREELKKIAESRIEDSRVSADYPSPFDDDALDYLIEGSNSNPRTLIRRCNGVLSNMILKGVKDPIDVDFIKAVFEGRWVVTISEMDAISAVIQSLMDDDTGWVKVKRVRALISEKYHMDIHSGRLGRILKNEFKLTQRNNPDSEYLFTR